MPASTVSREKLTREPLYRRIQQVMRERIALGDWAAGQMLPSRVQLCAEFGTTRVTLDKAIHELVRDGVLRSGRGSGTFISGGESRAASDHAAARTRRLGVLMGKTVSHEMVEKPDASNFYFGPLFQGICDTVAGQPVELVHAHYGFANDDYADYAGFCRASSLDGLLLVTPTLHNLVALHRLTVAQIPFVAVGLSSRALTDAALPFVDTDNRQGAADAVQHLLGLGHRRIAIVNLATAQANHHDRLEGYRCALIAAGAPADLRDLLLYPIHELGRHDEHIQAWLSQFSGAGDLPTAIFACDYSMAISTIRVLRQNGLRVPEDVSVVGFDDPFSAEHLTPALTTIRQPVYQVGCRAAQRLLESLRTGEPLSGAEILPTHLVVRESTCPPRSHFSLLL